MLVFGIAFGEEHVSTASIGVVQQEKSPYSDAFVDFLETLQQAPGEDIPEFEIIPYKSSSQAMEDLKIGELTGFLVIPPGFEEAVGKALSGEVTEVPLKLTYDETDPMSAPRIIPIIRSAALGFLRVDIPLSLEAKGAQPKVENEFINFFIPGITVFGLMILVPTGVRVIVSDKEKGFLSRLLTTPARPSDFILGYSLPFILVIIAQIIIYLSVGVMLGLKIIGNFGLAFLVFLVIGLCCIGIAMIIGTLVKSEAQGEPACWIFLVPMAMLSGAWFSVEGMHPVLRSIANAFPFIHGIDASRHVITTGATFTAISTDFYWLVGWTLALFTVGVILFRRRMVS